MLETSCNSSESVSVLVSTAATEVVREKASIFRTRIPSDERHKFKSLEKLSVGRRKKESIVPTMITLYPCDSLPCCDSSAIDLEHHLHCTEDDDYSISTIGTYVKLLENQPCLVDRRMGMARLMHQVNSELVDFKEHNSIAQAIVCGNDIGNPSETKHLRRVLASYFSDQVSVTCDERISSDSSSTDIASERSTLTNSNTSLFNLKLPALRILASSLELVCMLDHSNAHIVDLSSSFWVTVLSSIAATTEIVAESRLEALLSIKCIRLLYMLQPTTMGPYIRYSLLPYIMHAFEFGMENGDRMLFREAEKILKPLGIEMSHFHS